MGRSSLLEVEYSALEHTAISRRAELGVIQDLLSKAEGKLSDASTKSNNLEGASIFVKKFSEGLQSGVVRKFEDLLTQGLREIWGRNYTVRIDIEAKGTMTADFVVILPDGKEVSLKNGEGGGLRDFMAVLQRALYLVLDPSHRAKIMFLDENMKNVDSVRSVKAFEFIIGLLKELDIQVVWVTHSEAVKSMEAVPGCKVIDMTRTE